MRATLDFAPENRFTFAAFEILMLYPNTPSGDRLAREGRILFDGEWRLDPEYRLNTSFVPAQMTPDELAEIFLTRGASSTGSRRCSGASRT